MALQRAADPNKAPPPAQHHPRRCMNCGHLDTPDTEAGRDEAHAEGAGCLVPGGTKYLEDDVTKEGGYYCTCLEFVPSSEYLADKAGKGT